MATLVVRTKLLNNIEKFLDDYPQMSTVPYTGDGICLRGNFRFKAIGSENEELEGNYKIEIIVPKDFPDELPSVKELAEKITHETANGHLFLDNSLCLGSPLRLKKLLHQNPNLSSFASKCLVPFFYAVSHKMKKGGDLVFGELEHGNKGIVDDYIDLFGLKDHGQVVEALQLLGMKKRFANKKLCPCGCGKRLGVCSFHIKLNEFRCLASTSWFRTHAQRAGRN
ncbi:MAG: hypothetical protein ACI8PB_004388 [Desulforhopalus sp.]|jgi:hypothetical protein